MPRLSDLTPPPTPARGTFVGREAELREFRNSVRYLLGKEPPPGNNPIYPHVFLTYGEGGMGKTALVRQWRLVAGEEGMPDARVVLVDLDSAHCPTVSAFAQLLADAIAKQLPGFDRQFRATLARGAALGPRRDELRAAWQRWQALLQSEGDPGEVVKALRRRLAHGETQQAALGTFTPAYIALDMQDARRDLDALTSFYDAHSRGPRDFDELLRRELGPDAAFVADDERALGQALGGDLYELAEAAPLLLLLDTYERADQHDDWLRETVLAKEIISTQLLVVIAGREQIDAPYQRTFSGPHRGWVVAYDLNQRRFQAPEIRAYLRKRLELAADPPDGLTEQVLAISRGIPLAVQALGDQLTRGDLAAYRELAGQSLDERAVVAAMTERFLLYLRERPGDAPDLAAQKRRDRQRIRALALLRPGQPPDEQLAGCLWCEAHDQVHALFHELAARHSFVFRAGLFQMHELVHSFVRADMLAERRRAADWPTLASGLRRALALVDERLLRAERRSADPDERYADAEWRDAVLDRLNALLWLDEDQEARRVLLNRWIEARYNAPGMADELCALATELAPDTPDWRRLVAILRDVDYKALKGKVKVLETYAEAKLNHLLARRLRREEDLVGALAGYDYAIKLLPNDPRFFHGRGHVKRLPGDLAGALIDYDQALALRPYDAGTLSHRGIVKRQLNDLQSALVDYDQALALQPDDPNTLMGRGNVKSDLGDLHGALADYDRSLELRPDDPATLYNRGNVKSDLGDLAGALADYDRALELRPDHPATLTNRGIVKQLLGDLEGALADFDRALELRPDDPYTLNNRGLVKQQLGDLLGALTDFDQALAARPDDSTLLAARGNVKRALGNLAGALADYDRSLARHPNDPTTLTNRDIVKQQLSDLASELANVNQALAQNPDDADLLFKRGLLKQQLGDWTGALEDYAQVIAYFDSLLDLRSDDLDVLVYRGLVRTYAADFAGALADFERALELQPDDPYTMYGLACLYSVQGNADAALDWLTQVIEGDEEGAEEWRDLARANQNFALIRPDPRFRALVGK